MSKSQGDIDDLKKLQRQVEELRNRCGVSVAKDENEGTDNEHAETCSSDKDQDNGKKEGGPSQVSHGVAEFFEKSLKEIETSARERPVLTLLATFGVGVLVGKLFPRR